MINHNKIYVFKNGRIENYTGLKIMGIGKLDVLKSHQYKIAIKRRYYV